MPTLQTSQMWLCIVLVAVTGLLWLFWRSKSEENLPPGPPGLPLLGNALQLPTKFLFKKFDELKDEYGGIFTLNVAGQRIVVLGEAKIAADILDNMSAHTSGRPSYIMSDLMTRGMSFAVLSAGDRWRRSRRITHESFNSRAVSAYHSTQETAVAHLIADLLANPSDIFSSLSRCGGESAWRALYGRGEVDLAAAIKQTETLTEKISLCMSPVGSLINVFPFLVHIPERFSPWKRWASKFYTKNEEYLMSRGKFDPEHEETGFVASCRKARGRFDDITDAEIAWTAESMFSAALGTSTNALYFFVLAMVLHPETAKRAQAQLDTVVGGLLPTFNDHDRLPYVQALVKEVLRWRPVVPAGLPHMATEDLTYMNYRIPKDTWIFACTWSLSHDPKVYSEPETFRPERFLDNKGNVKTPAPYYHNEDVLTFGYGRRICPGRHFALDGLFIAFARLLWAFDFARVRDDNGKEIVPESMDIRDENLFIYPAPLPCQLRPRRNDLVEILTTECK